MAKVLILGGGFAGVVAAESLAKRLGREHQISLISRSDQFVFYPALVRLSFGEAELEDVSFDLRDAMINRRVTFVHGDIARVNTSARQVTVARGDFTGEMQYDFLVFALGRRLATERIHGFFEFARHLLTVEAALKFRNAVRKLAGGHVIVGQCPGARLPGPLFEAAFSLSKLFERKNLQTRITIVADETPEEMFGDLDVANTLRQAMLSRGIELITDFDIVRINEQSVVSSDGRALDCDLSLITPPFTGCGRVADSRVTTEEGYLKVDKNMRVCGVENVYAAGDCVDLPGPKMGHMAVQQAEVVAENVAREIRGQKPAAIYEHELMSVIDLGADTIFVHKDVAAKASANVREGRFWAWAKRSQEEYWLKRHA